MAIYRVVSEANFIEYTSTIFSEARREADKLLHYRKDEHFRVEEVTIVYHTAEQKEPDKKLFLQDIGCNWPACKCAVPDYAYSEHNRRQYCEKLKVEK